MSSSSSSASRPRPLSVAELLAAKKQSGAASSSAPRFLTKAERDAHAHAQAAAAAAPPRPHLPSVRTGPGPGPEPELRARHDYSLSHTSPSHQREYARPPGGASGTGTGRAPAPTAPVSQEEQDAIRERYLGQKPRGGAGSKKPRRDAKRWRFEHDLDDDTYHAAAPLVPSGGGHGPCSGASAPAAPPARVSAGRRRADPLLKPMKAGDERHWSEKLLGEMRERDWRIFREDFGISARGGGGAGGSTIPRPLRSWEESKIPPAVLDAIRDIGYTSPTPIQRQAIPIGLEDRDLIGVAETGSGKTASFLIPLLAYVMALPPLNEDTKALGPYALILVPTRELAQQIEVEARKFGTRLGVRTVSIVGGKDVDDQAHALEAGTEIVIATPGRLQDTLEKHILVLAQCNYVVMDEADRMLDMGFEPAVNFILSALPPDGKRVTMLYSATMPAPVERLARTYLRSPASITIGDANEASTTVEQRVEVLASDDKKQTRLLGLLREVDGAKIVFVNTILETDKLARQLAHVAGVHPAVLHSKRTQAQREEALAQLRSGGTDVLVSTNLAGRGIDVPNVSLVVNYQMSNTIEDYIHRIGRTGRAGNRGLAITFIDLKADEGVLYDLVQQLDRSPLSRVPPELARHPAAKTKAAAHMQPGAKRKRQDDELR